MISASAPLCRTVGDARPAAAALHTRTTSTAGAATRVLHRAPPLPAARATLLPAASTCRLYTISRGLPTWRLSTPVCVAHQALSHYAVVVTTPRCSHELSPSVYSSVDWLRPCLHLRTTTVLRPHHYFCRSACTRFLSAATDWRVLPAAARRTYAALRCSGRGGRTWRLDAYSSAICYNRARAYRFSPAAPTPRAR